MTSKHAAAINVRPLTYTMKELDVPQAIRPAHGDPYQLGLISTMPLDELSLTVVMTSDSSTSSSACKLDRYSYDRTATIFFSHEL